MKTIMKTITTFAIAALLFAVPNVAADTEVGSGHITAGSPATLYVSDITGVSNFFLYLAGVTGSMLSSSTVDNSGLGYDINFYFYDASDVYLGGCTTIGTDEVGCSIPANAAAVEVAAFYGFDLDVTVIAT